MSRQFFNFSREGDLTRSLAALVLYHPHSKEVSSYIQKALPVLQFVPMCTGRSLAPSFSTLKIRACIDNLLIALCLLQVKSPSSLSIFSSERCF